MIRGNRGHESVGTDCWSSVLSNGYLPQNQLVNLDVADVLLQYDKNLMARRTLVSDKGDMEKAAQACFFATSILPERSANLAHLRKVWSRETAFLAGMLKLPGIDNRRRW